MYNKLEQNYYNWIDKNFFVVHKFAPQPFMGPEYFSFIAGAAEEELGQLNVELFRVILVELIVELYEALTSIKRKAK